MHHHWHGYLWIGNGADREREAERRPTSPDFETSPLPPMRTGDWLLKPAHRIAETFYDLDSAMKWMAVQYEMVESSLLETNPVPLEVRLENARLLLPEQIDVQWGEWLTQGRFITVGVICCPNIHVPHPCPLGSAS